MNATTTTSNLTACHFCGSYHVSGTTCPRVRAIEYHDNGSIKRVEFHDVRPVPGLPSMPWDWTNPFPKPLFAVD